MDWMNFHLTRTCYGTHLEPGREYLIRLENSWEVGIYRNDGKFVVWGEKQVSASEIYVLPPRSLCRD